MKRKLVKQGAATMMISLPSKWIRENKLDKGDEIDLTEEGNKLIISKSSLQRKEIELTITIPIITAVQVMITNAYRADYNRVKVKYKDKKVYPLIKDLIDEQLLGYEVIEKGDGYCIIENIATLSETQFENIFSKLLMNIEETFDYAEQFLNGERPEFEKTQGKTKEFDNLCRRIIFREERAQSELRADFHSELVHAQREIYLLLLYLNKIKFKADKIELDLLRECRKAFEMLKEAYYTKSFETL
ncbi:MAG: AbrB/MazE/SpoVT family DNA-binding domain-containing protein, partial [archaeon]